MRMRPFSLLLFLLLPLWLTAQTSMESDYQRCFDKAYQACPDIPQGWLEAISFTNTQCHHLTDANYFNDGPDAMPRAYGLMGLVKDGKHYFRENLHLVAQPTSVSRYTNCLLPVLNIPLLRSTPIQNISSNRHVCQLSVCSPHDGP